jgi:26S proteasome non-ATPase regulatory subunit 9
VLKTDYKRLSDALERGIHALHSSVRAAGGPPSPPPAADTSAPPAPPAPTAPRTFAAAAAAAPSSEPKRPRLDAVPPAAPPPTAPAAAAAAAASGSSADSSPATSAPTSAFAVIDEVSANSPAESAGLQVGDMLLALAGVHASLSAASSAGGNGAAAAAAAMGALGPAVSSAEGRPVGVTVLRRGERVTLQLTPRRWEGRGLLGCHLRPLS